MEYPSDEEGAYVRPKSSRVKALAVSFDEKSRRNFVTGFRKRRLERVKEAVIQEKTKKRMERVATRKKRLDHVEEIVGDLVLPQFGAEKRAEPKDIDEVEYSGAGGVAVVRTVDLAGGGGALPPPPEESDDEKPLEREEIPTKPTKKRKWVKKLVVKKPHQFKKGKKKKMKGSGKREACRTSMCSR